MPLRSAALLRAAVMALAVINSARAIAAVDNPDMIDALQAKEGKQAVYLVIVQDRAWTPETHVMLGNKIGGYLRYALGGQLARDNPAAVGKPVEIVLVHRVQPSPSDEQILIAFRRQTEAAGLALSWGGEADLLRMVGE
jgi:hypothetical protein